MIVPYKVAGKSLKKKHPKGKPVAARGKKAMPTGKAPMFMPPGMEKETVAEGKLKNEEKE